MAPHTSSTSDESWKGCLAEAKPINCPNCKKPFHLDIYYYIDASAWPDWEDRLRSHDGETYACDHCGESIKIRSPLIVDFPKRDLVVFATSGGDDGGVEAGFRAFFEKMAAFLPSGVAEAARRRPYTFVHRHRGLLALLDYFHDRPVDLGRQGDRAQSGELEAIFTLQGYIYGKLFFYFPSQLAVQELVGLTVGAAIDLDREGHADAAIQLLSGTLDLLGDSHPWLSHELGRILIGAGRGRDAKVWLLIAGERRHSWHAVTASFLDATPVRRAGEEPQAQHLPHAMAADRLGSITAAKHTVMGISPATNDLDLWDFPEMAEAAIPAQYTEETVNRAHAFVLGTFDRHQFRELDPGKLTEATHVGWHRVQEVSRQLLKRSESLSADYWNTYIRSRWNLDVDVDSSNRELIVARFSAAQACLTAIDGDLALVPETDDDDNPYVFFAKGYVARDVVYFLTRSALHIRSRLYPLLKKLPGEDSRDLRHLLWRAVGGAIEEASFDFSRAKTLAELVEYFRAAIPALSDLYMAQPLNNSEMRFIGDLKRFATLAFKESIMVSDIEFLSRGSEALKARGLPTFGELLGHFVDGVDALGQQEHEEDHCLHCVLSSRCPTCSEETLDVVWDIINTYSRPDLEKRLKNGAAVGPRCRYCLSNLPRLSPLLYCDPVKNLYLLLCPDMNEAGEEGLRDYVSGYFKGLPPAYRDNREHVMFCSQYIARFENDDNCLVVCRVRSAEELCEVLRSRRPE